MPERRRRYWRTRFGGWVSSYKVAVLARDLSEATHPISATAVYGWLAGRTYPRPEYARAMVQLSRGSICLEDIYAHRASVQVGSSDEVDEEGEQAQGGSRIHQVAL